MSAMPDPSPRAVPISAGTEELRRMAEWYKSSGSPCREPFAPCIWSAGRANTNGKPGRKQRIYEQWDRWGSTEGSSGLEQRTQHTIKEWRDAWGLQEGQQHQLGIQKKIPERRDAWRLQEGHQLGIKKDIPERRDAWRLQEGQQLGIQKREEGRGWDKNALSAIQVHEGCRK